MAGRARRIPHLAAGVKRVGGALARRAAAHPWMMALGVLGSVISLVDGVVMALGEPSVEASALVVLCVTSSLWMAIHPDTGCWIVLVVQLLGGISSAAVSASFLMVSAIAVGLLAYLKTSWGLGAWLLECAFAVDVRMVAMGNAEAISNYAVYVMYCAVIMVCGIALRLGRQRDEQRRRNLEYRQNSNIAHRLHDYATNDLCGILLLIDRLKDDEDGQYADSIRMLADSALRHTREAIASLESLDEADSSSSNVVTPEESVVCRWKTVAEERRQVLDALGFRGTILVPEEIVCSISPQVQKLVCGIICELCGNVVKYARRNSRYVIAISVNDECLVVTSRNMISTSSTLSGMGGGLSRYRREVFGQNGSWEQSEDDGVWMLRVTIPCGVPVNWQESDRAICR